MALTPEELSSIPGSFETLYQDLEDFIINDFARRIARAGSITDSARLEIIRAKEIGISLKRIEEETTRILGLSKEKVERIFKDISMYSIEKDNIIYSKAGLSTIKIKGHKNLENIIEAAIKQTNNELFNLTRSMGFAQKVNGKVVYKPIAKYYQDAMDLATMQIKSGVSDYNTAIRQAIVKISNSGIRYVNYESGWTNRLDVAVRRAVLTGANQMTQKLTLQGMSDLGADFVETTAHVGARPSHAVWQGKVFSYSGNSKEYPSFIESTGYGTGPGLGGWNCRHSFFPFFPGISTPAYSEEKLNNIDPKPFEYNDKIYTYYQATQHQREIERAIRKTKTELIGYNAAGLKTDFINASIRLKMQEKYYKEFSKVAQIPMEKDRLQVINFGRSEAQKSVWANKKHEINEFKRFSSALANEAPKTLEEFKDMMYNKPIEFNKLKNKLSIVNMYQADFGKMDSKKILELDKLAFEAKKNNQISKYKSQGNFAVLQYNNKVKFASSRISSDKDKAFIKYKGNKEELVLLKDKRIFKTLGPGDIVDGEINEIDRFHDTEAKFFEYLHEQLKKENIKEIYMLSEKKMCESCRKVAQQFINMYPDIKVNVISGKDLQTWKGRK